MQKRTEKYRRARTLHRLYGETLTMGHWMLRWIECGCHLQQDRQDRGSHRFGGVVKVESVRQAPILQNDEEAAWSHRHQHVRPQPCRYVPLHSLSPIMRPFWDAVLALPASVPREGSREL